MEVVVASENAVKLEAAKRAFALQFPDTEISYITASVPSDVNDQPLSPEETALGAYNRAKNARQSTAKFSVGVEGGMCATTLNGQVHTSEQTWACVLDCETGVYEIGSGPAYPILPNILRHIYEGSSLTEAMALEYGIQDIGKKEGYNGWLSNNILNRVEVSKLAVLLALCGLMKEGHQNGQNR
jgi:inosine/xanthosine triphosphatase